MAIKDLSSTTVANILILISQVNDYKSAVIEEAKKSKAWDSRDPRHSKLAGAENPNGIKDWFNTYIKPTAPAPGTSTYSTTFVSKKEYLTIFYTVRTDIVSIPQDDTTIKALAALDKWLASMHIKIIGGKY